MKKVAFCIILIALGCTNENNFVTDEKVKESQANTPGNYLDFINDLNSRPSLRQTAFIERFELELISERKYNREGFLGSLRKEYGAIAWEQIIDLEDVLVIPIIKVKGDAVHFIAVLYASLSKGKFSCRLVTKESILKGKYNNGSMTYLYDLGFIDYYSGKVLRGRSEVAKLLESEIERQWGLEGKKKVDFRNRDKIIDFYKASKIDLVHLTK